MRVLVTGATGFIGSHVVQLLVESGHDVVALDTPEALAVPGAPRHEDARWLSSAADDLDALAIATSGIDAVSHQAFWLGTGRGLTDIRRLAHENDLGAASLMAVLDAHGFEGRIVLGSSTNVYGDGAYSCAEHGLVRPEPRRSEDLDEGRFESRCSICSAELTAVQITEDAPVEPRGITAISRVHQELLWRAYTNEHPDATVTTIRASNVYGPWMPRDTPLGGIVGVFRSQIDGGIRPQVMEDGGQRRDFVHAADVAQANLAALTMTHAYNGPLNIGSGRSTTLLEAATILCVARDSRLWPEVLSQYHLSDARHLVASSLRAQEVLGFRSRIGVQEGLAAFAMAPMSGPDALALLNA